MVEIITTFIIIVFIIIIIILIPSYVYEGAHIGSVGGRDGDGLAVDLMKVSLHGCGSRGKGIPVVAIKSHDLDAKLVGSVVFMKPGRVT